MFRFSWVLVLVVCMAIWPFANSGKAQDGESEGQSRRALSDRVDALENKIEMLEDKISRLQERAGNAEVNTDGVPPKQSGRVAGKGYRRGEWRKIGGGWTYVDPNAK